MTTPEGDIRRDRLGAAGDDFYTALIAAHEGLSFEESAGLNARLVLILANRVGDLEVLRAALEAAKPKQPVSLTGDRDGA